MMKIWKVEPTVHQVEAATQRAWVLAESAEEARMISGCPDAAVTDEADRLWISPDHIVWEKVNA